MRIGWLELVVILLVLLMVVGSGRFAAVLKGIKKGISNFKESASGRDE
ncbi:MAG: twin-arginine translocase TatA/TatE family subunit [Firmicutes bacterium]|nr:twin-arginine translocase TatA/TatE family subunit [Bacillota bacterium]